MKQKPYNNLLRQNPLSKAIVQGHCPTEEILVPVQKKKKAKRFEKLCDLPVETIEYTLEDKECICEFCGEALTKMKKEIRKEIKIILAQVLGGFVKAAESPKALFPKSLVSPSMLAFVINQKYACSMPLYRQEQEWNRLGVSLSRQNLSDWILKGAGLLRPLEQALKKQLLTEELLHVDEITLEVLREPGRAADTKSKGISL